VLLVLHEYRVCAKYRTETNHFLLQISTVHLPLLLAVVTGLCREGVRRGCLRAPTLQACYKTAQAFIPWTLTASIICALLLSPKSPQNADAISQPGHVTATGSISLALLLDAIVDPLYISAVYQGHSGYEMRAEVAAKLLESGVVWLLIVQAPGVRISLTPMSAPKSAPT
jgi:Rft protein